MALLFGTLLGFFFLGFLSKSKVWLGGAELCLGVSDGPSLDGLGEFLAFFGRGGWKSPIFLFAVFMFWCKNTLDDDHFVI